MKRMSIVVSTVLMIAAQNHAVASNFGDEVARCVTKYGIPANSPRLSEAFTSCENEVDRNRNGVVTKTDEFMACLKSSSRRLDDYLSPASEIATAIAFDCESKWNSVLISNGQIVDHDGYPSQTIRGISLKTVLEQRAIAKEPKSRLR